MTTPLDDQISTQVREDVDTINAMYERLKIGQASEAEADLLNTIAAEGLLNGRGAALTLGLDLLHKLRLN
jgi:hypothetical protein